MHYIAYMNAPLHTVNAKAVDRAQIEKALESIRDLEWSAPERPTVPLPERRCPVKPKPPARRAKRLSTEDVLKVVPQPILAELMGLRPIQIDRWGVSVPQYHEAWLRDLMAQWPTLNVLRERLQEGAKPEHIAKELHMHKRTLGTLCAEFGIHGWPLEG